MSGAADFYPFLSDAPPDLERVLADARRSTLQKAADVDALREATWRRHAADLVAAAQLLVRALRAGGTVLAFGNGGSATDAHDLVDDLVSPPLPHWRPLPALDLTRDCAVLTAIGNDVGFDKVFARQIIAHGRAGDVAVGFSTSGQSPNVVEALIQARRQGLATIGFAGDRGGRFTEPGLVDVAIVVPSPHNTRIQETHATACHTMLEMVQALYREDER